jgi:hypothetical protein
MSSVRVGGDIQAPVADVIVKEQMHVDKCGEKVKLRFSVTPA